MASRLLGSTRSRSTMCSTGTWNLDLTVWTGSTCTATWASFRSAVRSCSSCGTAVSRFLTGVLQQIGDSVPPLGRLLRHANHIPVVRLKSTDRNIDLMRRYLSAAAATGRSQVAAIGVAQEPQRVFIARRRQRPGQAAAISFDKKDRRVTVYYF